MFRFIQVFLYISSDNKESQKDLGLDTRINLTSEPPNGLPALII
jgi:hypothetical protein